ncbi:hypothetical protein N9W34_05350 [Rickettsiales bacterium]|nr:hypothetical protein [Rickettsiales bacterium]
MGHVRLSRLPRTKQWKEVVNLLNSGKFSVQEIAEASANAANKVLQNAAKDPVLNEVFKLLCLLPRAAKENDMQKSFSNLGIITPKKPTLPEIIQGFVNRVNELQASDKNGRTDIGEMAKQVGASVLIEKIEKNSSQLWEPSPDDIRHGLAKLSDPARFADMAQNFLSSLTGKILRYYLDREIPKHISASEGFSSIQDMRTFNKALEIHCVETSFIMRAFAKDWYGKTYAYYDEIDDKKARGFIYIATNKIVKELAIRGKNA